MIEYLSYIVTSEQNKLTTTLVVSTISIATLYLVLKLRKKYSFFTSRNVPGPRPWPFIGHLHKFMGLDMGAEIVRLSEEYGKIYGLYFGLEPRLMIADPELLIQICIKDFDCFTDHYGLSLRTKYQDHFLFLQKGNNWRRNRIFVSPTFTSGKIKQMYKLIDICALDLNQLIKEQIDVSDKRSAIIHGKEIFSMYTLDAIARSCYGLNLEREKGVHNINGASARNEFVAMCTKLFENNILRILPEVLMPTKLMRSLGYTVVPESTFEPVANAVQKND